MVIKGSQRIAREDMDALNPLQKINISSFLKMAPGWCEISYVNEYNSQALTVREYLLGWVFSCIKSEYGFALFLARSGKQKFHDPLFDELITLSLRYLSGPMGYFRFIGKGLNKCLQKFLGG